MLPELDHLETIVADPGPLGRASILDHVEGRSGRYPIHAISFGSTEPTAPTFVLVGGVHGLERIGTKVVLSYLTMLRRLLEWDELLRESLRHTRVLFVPLLNPVGMAEHRRSNGNGVDLMRNAPVTHPGLASFLVGGQRLSRRLPWYMGAQGAPMEREAQALCRFIETATFQAETCLVLDVHSGFGMEDRLWFPYARTRRPYPGLANVYALNQLLDRTLPHHFYRLEPQAGAYTIQGDLWDHLYDRHREAGQGGTFLPITLEMGSWLWVKKNPRQVLSVLGAFNPIKPHRRERILRRHLLLFDFLRRAVAAPDAWAHLDPDRKRTLEAEAFSHWYGR